MKRLNSLQQEADASIWQFCVELMCRAQERFPQMFSDVVQAVKTIVAWFLAVFIVLFSPVAFPIIAYYLRRKARSEVARFESLIDQDIGEEWASNGRKCFCHKCCEDRDERMPGSPDWPYSAGHMIVCETCGNKRCPRANNHRNECTNSNTPGQPGSAF